MKDTVLKYTSREIYVDFYDNKPKLSEFEVDGIMITEIYSPNPKYHGEYRIQLSKQVENLDDLHKYNTLIEELCRKLSVYATYSLGQPIDTYTKDFFGSKRYIQGIADVKGWNSNYKDVDKAIKQLENPTQNVFVTVSSPIINHWVKIDYSPLKDMIVILTKAKTANALIHKLIYFHSQALKNEHDIRYLIFGKALEIAKELLPDKNLKKSFKALPKELIQQFKDKDINWLYNMSNSRIETRHIINKRSDSLLHPEMSEEEINQFANLSDMLINYIVRNEFGLEPMISIK